MTAERDRLADALRAVLSESLTDEGEPKCASLGVLADAIRVLWGVNEWTPPASDGTAAAGQMTPAVPEPCDPNAAADTSLQGAPPLTKAPDMALVCHEARADLAAAIVEPLQQLVDEGSIYPTEEGGYWYSRVPGDVLAEAIAAVLDAIREASDERA